MPRAIIHLHLQLLLMQYTRDVRGGQGGDVTYAVRVPICFVHRCDHAAAAGKGHVLRAQPFNHLLICGAPVAMSAVVPRKTSTDNGRLWRRARR